MEFILRIRSLSLVIAATLAWMSGGCGKKADVESSAAELEKAFQAPAIAAPAPATSTAPNSSTQSVNDLIKTALESAKANDYANGIITLQNVQQKPGVTAEQLMAVHRTMKAMTTDLLRRADAGDQRALEQLRAIEKTRSQ